MFLLILGLVIFLGAHSVRIFADGWRDRQISRFGAQGWKGIYSLVSLVGFVVMIVGFGQARANPVLLYASPGWLRHRGWKVAG